MIDTVSAIATRYVTPSCKVISMRSRRALLQSAKFDGGQKTQYFKFVDEEDLEG